MIRSGYLKRRHSARRITPRYKACYTISRTNQFRGGTPNQMERHSKVILNPVIFSWPFFDSGEPQKTRTPGLSLARKNKCQATGTIFLAIVILGCSMFSVFEVETPRWRKLFKWLFVISVTIGLYYVVGHVALVVPIGLLALGTMVHFVWCRRNGIDPIHATPRALH